MDIRNFFGGAAAIKKTTPVKECDQKKTVGKTKAKQKTPTSKKQPQINKKTQKEKKPKPVLDEDDDVEIIELSEDEKSKVETVEQKKKSSKKNLEGKGGKKDESVQKEDQKANGHSEDQISKKKKTKNSSNDELKSKPKEKEGKKSGIQDDSDSDGEMVKKTKKRHRSKKSSISLSDSDSEEPVAQKRKHKSKKISVLDSDSESEDPVPKKQKRRHKRSDSFYDSDEEVSGIKEAFAKVTPKPTKPNLKPKSVSPARKSVDIKDFFGMAAVQRSDRKTVAVKRKAEASPDKSDKDERDFEMHDEDSFEKTLQELDKRKPLKKAKTESPKEESVTKTEGKSLASKLADKSKVFVPDTPDKPPISNLKKPETPKTKQHVTSERTPVKVTPTKTPVKTSPGKPSTSSTWRTPGKTPPNAVHTTPSHAKKTSPTKSDVGTPGDTPLQRRGSNYRAYKDREGPRALGSKEIPEGAENCLEDLTFVITGVLESMERDEAKSLVEKYGGRVTGSVSKKTTYLLAGRDAGNSKLAKAESLGTKHIDEDGLLDLIRTRPGKKSKYVIAAEKEAKSVKSTKKMPETIKPEAGSWSSPVSLGKHQSPPTSHSSPSLHKTSSPEKKPDQSTEALLWVDKYKPTSLKQIIGQQGDKSNARKLCHWLKTWHQNRGSGKKPSFNRFNDDGSGSRAALLSGPPGVGKTTTAQLVCQEVGFSFVELNASDTRSKKNLEQEVAEALGNHTLVDFFDEQKSGAVNGHRHCLVMDEVDGMAGSEDRGGMQELIQLIKSTKIPIICMCNDRNHPKVRSLSNYCFDLRFQRPRLEQIKSAMMSISFKERLKIPPAALNEVILAANQDVRQVIHNLSLWSSNEKNLTYEQLKEDASKAKKDFKLSPFDACRKVFIGGEETAKMTIHDKADLFFNDYSLSPLFVQENYLQTTPFAARGDIKKHLEMVSRASDSIADGDLVGRHVRQNGKWNLLPLQAIFSSVIPGEFMRGSIGMVQFPAWLGKNSSRNKIDRLLQELRTHMRLKLSADKRGLNMEYLPHMRRKLTAPLVKEGQDGVQDAVAVLNEYDLLREDFDNILEISSWPGMKDPMSQVESKVKAAFTRTYNKESHMTPYSTAAMSKKSKKRGGGAELEEGMEGEEEGLTQEDEDEEDITADAMIKQKKKPAAKGKSKASSTGETSGKGKGKGRGKGKR